MEARESAYTDEKLEILARRCIRRILQRSEERLACLTEPQKPEHDALAACGAAVRASITAFLALDRSLK